MLLSSRFENVFLLSVIEKLLSGLLLDISCLLKSFRIDFSWISFLRLFRSEISAAEDFGWRNVGDFCCREFGDLERFSSGVALLTGDRSSSEKTQHNFQ